MGSNAEEATEKFVEIRCLESVETIALISSQNVVRALSDGRIDFGVMAICNLITGEVTETKEALRDNIKLIDQTELPIHHCLFGKEGVTDISAIASHPQALAQTAQTRKKFFDGVSEVACADTALAAKMLSKGKFPENYGVICAKNAGLYYGLSLVMENIEDIRSNKTTFGLFCLKKNA